MSSHYRNLSAICIALARVLLAGLSLGAENRSKITHNKFVRISTAVLLVLAFGLSASAVQVAHAAGIVVNTLSDADATDGQCSLREAIIAANTNADYHECTSAAYGVEAIAFNVSGTITLASSLPNISDSAGLMIDGTGHSVTISGNNAVSVLQVNSGAVLTVTNLTIANGHQFNPGG